MIKTQVIELLKIYPFLSCLQFWADRLELKDQKCEIVDKQIVDIFDKRSFGG